MNLQRTSNNEEKIMSTRRCVRHGMWRDKRPMPPPPPPRHFCSVLILTIADTMDLVTKQALKITTNCLMTHSPEQDTGNKES